MASEPTFTPYEIKQGDTFSKVAYLAYGDPTYVHTLITDNPHLQALVELPAGYTLWARVKIDPETGALIPPWFQEDTVKTDTPLDSGAVIPVTDGPAVPLAFASGFPKIAGSRIQFAVNLSGRYTYTVENMDGVVFFQSSGYDFSANFPIETPEILQTDIYRVKVASLVSSGLTVTGSAAAFSFDIEPYFSRNAGKLYLNFSVNKTGTYITRLSKALDGVEISTANLTMQAEQLISLEVNVSGTIVLEVGTTPNRLIKTVSETTSTETRTKPAYLVKVGITTNISTRDTSIQAQATGNIELKIVGRNSTPNPSGIGWQGVAWDSSAYIPGTTEYVDTANGYTEIFRVNGTAPGVGGLVLGGEYTMYWRLETDRSVAYLMDFTMPSATITYPDPPQVLPFPTVTPVDPTLPACDRGPTVGAVESPTTTSLKFLFDGNGVYSIKWEIFSILTNAVVRNDTVVVATPNGSGGYTAVFSPGNKPTISYNALDPGAYQLRIQGGSCSSLVTTASFTVDAPGGGETPLAFVSGYPNVFDDSGNKKIRARINRTGVFATSLYNNSTNSSAYSNSTKSYAADEVFVIPANLAPGNYTLQIGTLTYSTTITAPGTDISYINNSNRVVEKNGLIYRMNNSRAATWQVLANGNVRLELRTEKPSRRGTTTVYPNIILGSLMQDLKPALKAALLSATGIAPFPRMRTQLHILYIANGYGTTAKELVQTTNGDIAKVLSVKLLAGQAEYCSISIESAP